jgi:hypothetical protein
VVATKEVKEKVAEVKKADAQPIGSKLDTANTKNSTKNETKPVDKTETSKTTNSTKNTTSTDKPTTAKKDSTTKTTEKAAATSDTEEKKDDVEPTGKESEKHTEDAKVSGSESGLLDIGQNAYTSIKAHLFFNGVKTEIKPVDSTNLQLTSTMSITDKIRNFFGYK